MQTERQIAELAFLSDCRGAALVDRRGTVVWWCPGRFDGDAWFAGLLGEAGGLWALQPHGVRETSRAYDADTLVLTTTFVTESGVVELSEGLVFAPGARGHEIGLESPATLARVMRCTEGVVELTHRFEPRCAYGLVAPRFERNGLVLEAHGSSGTLFLFGADELRGSGRGVAGDLRLDTGDERAFAATLAAPGGTPTPVDPLAALEDTRAGWRSWTELHEQPTGVAANEVALAARVLQGLTYQRSGAIVAAPVTSLPEVIGGDANWDYRYAWLRDSSLVIHALRRATCADEATRYLEWMARVAHDGEAEGETQAFFGVEGERLLQETSLTHLGGFAASQPVRIGNGAWCQRQLDVYGHVLEAASAYDGARHFEPAVQRFLCQLATRAARTWREPDHGIWELRGEPRHHTSSKLQCWVALERALALSDGLGTDIDLDDWRAERRAVREWLEASWDDRLACFPAWPGTDELDAAALLAVVTGFLSPGDARAAALVESVEQTLGRDGLLVRSSTSEDGAFLLCSCWHVQALVALGRLDRAGEVFERIRACANDVGLLPEEVDPRTGQALGNVPLALSHAGLVGAASAIQDAREAGRSVAGAGA